MDSASEVGSSRILRLFKVSRLLRLAGMLRMARVADQSRRITDRFLSDALRNVMHIVSLLIAIFWLNHIFGCIWFALGKYGPSDTDVTWVEDRISGKSGTFMYQDLDAIFQYTTALHWSITQMTPGSIPLQPMNSVERVFNIACLIFGLLFFSSIVSSLSAQMTQLKMMGQERSTTLATLDRFLRENNISRSLGVSVKRQVEERMDHRRPLALEDVKATALLSESLRTELRTELCRSHLLRHQFFRLVEQVDVGMFQDLCNADSVGFYIYMQQDSVFFPSKQLDITWHVIQGELLYVQDPRTSKVKQPTQTPVRERSWLCWASLWSTWYTVGTVEAVTVCELFSVKGSGLQGMLSNNPTLSTLFKGYCVAFHELLIAAKPPAAAYPNDLEVPYTDHRDVVMLMNRQRRCIVGILALEVLQTHRLWRLMVKQTDMDALEEEVHNGKSTLAEHAPNIVERLAAVAVVLLRRRDGKVLVQLGKWEAGAVVPKANLPGSKLHDCEKPTDGVKRVLREELEPFADRVRLEQVEQRIEVKESARFKLKTRYTRSIQHCVLETTDGLPPFTHVSVASLCLGNRDHHQIDELFLLKTSQPKEYLCSWMDMDMYELVAKSGGDKMLKQWLAGARLDEVRVIGGPKDSVGDPLFFSSAPLSVSATSLETEVDGCRLPRGASRIVRLHGEDPDDLIRTELTPTGEESGARPTIAGEDVVV